MKWFNTAVCKTAIHRFESGRRLHNPGAYAVMLRKCELSDEHFPSLPSDGPWADRWVLRKACEVEARGGPPVRHRRSPST